MDYLRLQRSATNLLKRSGQELAFGREAAGSFDPASGAITGSAQSSYTAYGVVLNYANSEIDEKNIIAGDRKIVCEIGTTAPVIGDTVDIASQIYRVQSVAESNPAGTPVIYTLQVRR